MKLHELFENRPLMASNVTLKKVKSLKDLIDPKTGEYYTAEVNVTGDVNLNAQDKDLSVDEFGFPTAETGPIGRLAKFPVKFGIVNGEFDCSENQLTSLEGAPLEVGGTFICFNNKLTSLKHAPKKVKGSFLCYHNKLTALDVPLVIGGDLDCRYNQITSLKNIHKMINEINGGTITFGDQWGENPIKSGGIGLILIKGLTKIQSDLPAPKIIKTYLRQGKAGLLRCQDELIEADLEEYANL